MGTLADLRRMPGLQPRLRDAVPHQGQGLIDLSTGVPGRVFAPGVGVTTVALFVNLADIAAADLLTGYTPGYRFALLGVAAAVEKPASTAAKAATLTPKISGVAVTGGVLALTSANMTPQGAVLNGTAVTGANVGSATSTISITGSAVTAFVEGSAWIMLKVQNLDTADAIASLASLFGS